MNGGRNFGISEAGKALRVGYKQIPVKLHIITLDIVFFVIVTIILPRSYCHNHLGYSFRVICEDSSEVVSMKTTTNTPTSLVIILCQNIAFSLDEDRKYRGKRECKSSTMMSNDVGHNLE